MATSRPSRQLETDSVKLGLLILSLGYLHYSKVKEIVLRYWYAHFSKRVENICFYVLRNSSHAFEGVSVEKCYVLLRISASLWRR